MVSDESFFPVMESEHKAQVELHQFENDGTKAHAEEQHFLVGEYKINDNGSHESNHENPVEHSSCGRHAVAGRFALVPFLPTFSFALRNGFCNDFINVFLIHLMKNR